VEKKSALLIGAIIAILILAVVLAYFLWPSEYNQEYNKQYKNCIAQNQKQYILSMAKKTGDASYCEQNTEIKESCTALAQKNPEIYCADIELEFENARKKCYAETMRDPAQCPPEDNWCIAIASGDPQFCNKLDAEDTEECKRLLPQNAEYWISEEANKECEEIATNAAESRIKLKSI